MAATTSTVRNRWRWLRVYCRAGLACLVLLGSLGSSLAHVQKAAVTRILFNANSGNMEVMHRLLVHDVEHAATLLFGERQTLLESAESRELISSYVINRFAIAASVAGSELKPLPLHYVGSEIDGQFLWVYQEVAVIPDITALSIVNSVLMDVWPDQQNLVNIEREAEIHTLNFSADTDQLSVAL